MKQSKFAEVFTDLQDMMSGGPMIPPDDVPSRKLDDFARILKTSPLPDERGRYRHEPQIDSRNK